MKSDLSNILILTVIVLLILVIVIHFYKNKRRNGGSSSIVVIEKHSHNTNDDDDYNYKRNKNTYNHHERNNHRKCRDYSETISYDNDSSCHSSDSLSPLPTPPCVLPNQVGNLTANFEVNGLTRISVEWSVPVGGADSYRIVITGPSPTIDTSGILTNMFVVVLSNAPGIYTIVVYAINSCGQEIAGNLIMIDIINPNICDPECEQGTECVERVCVCATPVVDQVELVGAWETGLSFEMTVGPNLIQSNMQWEIGWAVFGETGISAVSGYFSPAISPGIIPELSSGIYNFPAPSAPPGAACFDPSKYGCPDDRCPEDHGVYARISIRPINNCGETQISGETYCFIANWCQDRSSGRLIMTPVECPP